MRSGKMRGEDADDGMTEVRRTLDEKARFARQYEAIQALQEVGPDPDRSRR